MKVYGIVGSRRRTGPGVYKAVDDALMLTYTDGDELVSGGCPTGADHIAESIAKKRQIPIKIYYAKWDKLGRRAGFVRNTDIAEDADYLIAAVTSDRTGGTEDTITKWLKMRDLTEEKAITAGLLRLV